jgi:hypothetical protein
MAERCAVTELLVAHCGCPKHRPDLRGERVTPPARGVTFEAKYAGRCSKCATTFEPGEDIHADGEGGYLGECCGEDGDA